MFKKIISAASVVIAVFAIFYFSSSSRKTTGNEVVVSIKPLHSLVCALTKGITAPVLLLDGYVSPHHAQLQPSQVQLLKNAKIVVWIGPIYEQLLTKHIQDLKGNILSVQDSSLIKLKPLRSGRFWDEQSCCHCDEHDHHHRNHSHKEANLDGHIWLNPLIMLHVVDVVLERFKQLYPNHHDLLDKNANDYKARLHVLHQQLLQKIAPYKGKQYIIQHDGNQYFDAVYGVKTIATISIDPSVPPSAGHILKIRKAIQKGIIHPKCLYAERQMGVALVKSYAETLQISFAAVDYLGVDIKAGEGAYEALMNAYVDAFIEGVK